MNNLGFQLQYFMWDTIYDSKTPIKLYDFTKIGLDRICNGESSFYDDIIVYEGPAEDYPREYNRWKVFELDVDYEHKCMKLLITPFMR